MPIERSVRPWMKIVTGASVVSSQARCLLVFQEAIIRSLHPTFGTLREILLLVADRTWSLTSTRNNAKAPLQHHRRK